MSAPGGPPRAWRGVALRVATLALAVAAASPAPAPCAAQEAHGAATTALREARDFRVRARAALALGRSDAAVAVPALARALRDDPHPTVRTAAATALGRLADARALPALREAREDRARTVRLQVERALRAVARAAAREAAARPPAAPDRPDDDRAVSVAPAPRAEAAAYGSPPRVSWGRVERVLVVGAVDDRTGYGGEDTAAVVRDALVDRLRRVPKTAVFPAAAAVDRGAEAEIARRGLPRLRVDARWSSLSRRERDGALAVRCGVDLLLVAEPSGALRGTASGAVTATAAGAATQALERRLVAQALEGAVRAALADAADALERAAAP